MIEADCKNIEESVARELELIFHYLLGQRYINHKDTLAVHIIFPALQMKILKGYAGDMESRQYYIHTLEEAGDATADFDKDYCAAIFSGIYTRQKPNQIKIGSADIFRQYHQTLYARYIRATSIAMFLFSCFVFIYVMSEIKWLEDKININQHQSMALDNIYQKNLAPMNERLAMAIPMKSSVAFAKRLRHSIDLSPGKAILQISRLLSKVEDLQVSSILLHKSQQTRFSNPRSEKSKRSRYSDSGDIQYIKLRAYMERPKTSSESILDRLKNTRKILESEKGIADIDFTGWPLDPNSKMNRVVELGGSASGKKSAQNTFEIGFLIKQGGG